MEPLVSRRSFHNPFFIAGLSGVEIVQQVPLSYNREGFVVATQIGSENSYFRHKWQRCSRSNTYEKQPTPSFKTFETGPNCYFYDIKSVLDWHDQVKFH